MDATLSEALDLLRTRWAPCLNLMLRDGYVLWLGSGISRACFPDLSQLIEELLVELYTRHNPSDPACPFRAASLRIGKLAAADGIDFTQSPASWDATLRKDLLRQLCGKYAYVLEVPVCLRGGGSLSIPWDILRLQDRYSDPAVMPDAEHRLLALLAAEGIVSEMVSANWDPLIERAHEALGLCTPLAVIAHPDELDGARTPVLFKIHGCAERTRANLARYQPFLLATQAEIAQWTSNAARAPFRDKLVTMLRERPMLVIGLSIQDPNLQAQCVPPLTGREPFPQSPPRAIFSAQALAESQRSVLRILHGEDYNLDPDAMEGEAALPLYAKPLLGALYVATVLEKLRIIVERGATYFPHYYCAALAISGVSRFEQRLRARYDAIADPQQRWRQLTAELPAAIARCLRLYLHQQTPADPCAYHSLHARHIGGMESDTLLPESQLHWLALAVSALEAGSAHWTFHSAVLSDGQGGHCRVILGAEELTIFLPKRDQTAQRRLEDSGALVRGSGRRVLLLYPCGSRPARRPHAPMRMLPGTHSTSSDPVSETWLEDLATDSPSAVELLEALRDELLQARPF